MNVQNEKRIGSEDTKGKILESLLSDDLNALELAEFLDINESAIRRHLNTLESEGLIESYFEKASKGRPKKYFTTTDEGKRLFPNQVELLLELIIKNLIDEFDRKISSKLSDKMVQELIKLFPDLDDHESLDGKIEKVSKGFDDLGFYCDFSRSDSSYEIEYRNCAFGNISDEEARWLCAIHKRVLKELLDEDKFQQEKSMLEGDNICVQKIGV